MATMYGGHGSGNRRSHHGSPPPSYATRTPLNTAVQPQQANTQQQRTQPQYRPQHHAQPPYQQQQQQQQQHRPYQQPVSPSSGGSVNFHSTANQGSFDKLKQRERIITVRYGAHQMKLIRKRLAIEEWLDEELRKLYQCQNETDDYDTEIDLDEVLDLATHQEQVQFLREKVANANQPPEVIKKFIRDVLDKASTL